MKEAKKKLPRLGFIGLGLFFLAIPGVNVYDILPDFIAYFIFSAVLSYPADRAPYFAEAKDAFTKLGIVTLIKIPASLAMSYIRSGNTADSDIRSLFSLTFAVVELILIFSAVNSLFNGFSYLGERTDHDEYIVGFSKPDEEKKFSVEGVKILTLAFAVYKCSMYVLPELLLLTRGVSAEDYYKTFNVAKLYPYAVIFSLITVLIFGIIWFRRIALYLRVIKSGGGLRVSSEELINEERQAELDSESRLRKMKNALTAIAVASVLSFELRLENLRSVNLLPTFIFGFVMLFAMTRLGSFVGKKKIALLSGAGYILSSFISCLFDFAFFKEYGYADITIFPDAKKAYLALVYARAVESLLFVFMMISLCVILVKFLFEHTVASPSSDRYSRQDLYYHNKMKTFAYIMCGLGVLAQVVRLIDCIFKYHSKNILVSVDTSIGTVTEGLVPWFGVVVVIVEVIYIGFSLYAVSTFKDELQLKYEKDKV